MEINAILKNYGLSDKEVAVYMALIEVGPSAVRTIALKSGVNRGTTYDILRALMHDGLATYFNKQTKQYFVAEPPQKLIDAIAAKQQQLESVKQEVSANLPELQVLFESEGGRPQVKLYEGKKGIQQILEDVLNTMSDAAEKIYYAYSSANVRENVQKAMPEFSDKRIKKGLTVHTIALGPGGETRGLDERKWMPASQDSLKSTYELIYNGKVAHISLDNADMPVGVLLQNDAIYQTQKMIFEFNWSRLSS